MSHQVKIKKLNRLFISCSGGIVGGLSVSNNFWLLMMPISLCILWYGFDQKKSNFFWGFFFILSSHYWLLSLHPLTWLGYKWFTSLIISFSVLFICSILGGILVSLWGLLGKKFLSTKKLYLYTRFQIFIKVLYLSCFWALGELILKQTPFFWIGISESLIPGDLYLAGLARWFGASGLCIIQLLIGFWMFFIYEKWRRQIIFKNLLYLGLACLISLHFLGYFLILPEKRFSGYPVAAWQTNIPTRQKIFIDNKKMLTKVISAQEKALSKNAKLLITPEGTLNSAFSMSTPSLIDTLAGGFRTTKDDLRSSLLFFKKGDKNYSNFIDKNRLVPLGEKTPKILNQLSLGNPSLGNLQSGDDSRYFNWNNKTPPMAIAICYEISNGLKIREAINFGSELILSIANLDPYPRLIQKQFISLARLRSIENNRDTLIISNNGPTGLVKNDGRISNLFQSSIEELNIIYPNFHNKITIYNKLGEKPLIVLFITLILLNIFLSTKLTNQSTS